MPNGLKTNFTLGIVFSFVSFSIYADSLWKVSSTDCTLDGFTNLYTSCKSIPRSNRSIQIGPAGITQTNISFVKSLAVKNRIAVSFPCQSSQDLNVYIAMGAQENKLSLNDSGKIIESYVNSQNPANYELLLNEAGETFHYVNTSCKITVDSNISLPQSAPLKWYAMDLIQQAQQALANITNLDNAQTLPAKWAVVQAMPTILQSQIQNKELELSFKKDDAQTLENQGSLTAFEEAQLEDLTAPGGIIETLEAEIAKLQTLKADVESGIPSVNACTSGVAEEEAQCLSEVNAIKTLVSGQLSQVKNKMSALRDFLNAEGQRLSSIQTTLSQQLNNLVAELNSNLN